MLGPCEYCGDDAEWWLETHRSKVSLDHGVSPGQLVEQVPICADCMAEMVEEAEDE